MTPRPSHRVTDPLAFGESARAILKALSKSKQRSTLNGMVEFDLHLSKEEAPPFVRALMRAEAQLLLNDADAFGEDTPLRTPEQRRCDALLELVTATTAALA